jgi:hypothetical protein
MSVEYDLKSVKMPYLSGGMLRLFAGLAEGPLRRRYAGGTAGHRQSLG